MQMALTSRVQGISQRIGANAERYALHYLQRQGLQLLVKNYHSRYGEIDLIMLEQDCVVFVEVRARKHNAWLSASESVDRRKQQKIIKTAQHYLQNYAIYADKDCRFDVIAIDYRADEIDKADMTSVCHETLLDSTVQWIQNAYWVE